MKALVINLDRDLSRWERVQTGMSGILDDLQRISAVDGRMLTEKWHHLSRWMHVTHEPNKFNIMPAIGCFLSHRKCWQYVVDNNLPHALVLEDDTKPTQLTKAFLNDFDIRPPPVDWVKLHVHRRKRRTRQAPLDFEVAGVRLCVDIAGSKSNAAYIISNAGARKALGYRRLLAPADHTEWLHLTHSVTFAQTWENVVEIDGTLPSSITSQVVRNPRRLLAISRIGLIRLTVIPALNASNMIQIRRSLDALK